MKFATLDDVNVLFRPLAESEKEKAEKLLSIVSDRLRVEAERVGKNIDEMYVGDSTYANVVRSVVVDVVGRALMTPTNEAPVSQFSQSAMGYSVSGTYLVPGGGIFIKKSELATLGLRRQRYGMVDMYGSD